MDWTQFATFMIANMVFTLTLWLWNRTESRSDMRAIHQTIADDRKDILSMIRAIHDEMKDFHGRLERHDAEFKAHLMYHHKEGK